MNWSRNFMDQNIYSFFSNSPPAVCNIRMTKPVLSLPQCYCQNVSIPSAFAIKINHSFVISRTPHVTPKQFYRINICCGIQITSCNNNILQSSSVASFLHTDVSSALCTGPFSTSDTKSVHFDFL
jgi:hypothetical protein